MSVWLVVPAYRRAHVSRVSFAGIAWLIAQLAAAQIEAHALVIADDNNLDIANEYGLDTLRRPNRPLGRKWNDGYEHACRSGATYVMPCGSDDWIHPTLVLSMLAAADGDAIVATRSSSAVAPDGTRIACLTIPYEGGDGISLLPASLLEHVGYRPTKDERDRAIDGAMRDKLSRNKPIRWTYVDTNPLHIVDFKSDANLTAYEKFAAAGYVDREVPFGSLYSHYPAQLVEQAAELQAPR